MLNSVEVVLLHIVLGHDLGQYSVFVNSLPGSLKSLYTDTASVAMNLPVQWRMPWLHVK